MAKKIKSKKQLYNFKNKYLLGAAIIVAVVLVSILSRSSLKAAYYGYQAHTAFSNQLKDLRVPLDTLGFKGITGEPAKCSKENIYGYSKIQLQCIAYHQAYVAIGNDENSKAKFNAAAQSLTELLKDNGWTISSNAAPTVALWFQGITSGKDWYPDIGGRVSDKNSTCMMDINVAYSNPKPAAFSMQVACSSPVLNKSQNNSLL